MIGFGSAANTGPSFRAIDPRTGEQLPPDFFSAGPEEVNLAADLAHLANISYRLGRKLAFDPKTLTFPGDAEANRMLTRPQYRGPYIVPEKV